MSAPAVALTIAQAQRDMRDGYAGGAAGMLASALAWVAAATVALQGTPRQSMFTLFFAGMLIHPVGVLLAKLLRRRASHAKGNPMARLAMESTILMIACIPLAFGAAQAKPAWFFQAMLMIIGGRYLIFATIYGMRVYWLCSAALGAAGYLLFSMDAPLAYGACAGAAIEIVFAVILYAMVRKDVQS